MKLNSNFILEILNIFIWIYTFILCIALSIMIFVFFATLFGIDIGSMKEMTINLDVANEKIKDIQSLGKGKSLLILAYAVISGTLELIMFTSVIKILKKLKSNQFFFGRNLSFDFKNRKISFDNWLLIRFNEFCNSVSLKEFFNIIRHSQRKFSILFICRSSLHYCSSL